MIVLFALLIPYENKKEMEIFKSKMNKHKFSSSKSIIKTPTPTEPLFVLF